MTSKATAKPGSGKLRGDEDFDGLVRSAESLPAEWYIDPGWYQHELESVFYNNWLYLCHASTLAENRSIRRFRIGTQEIFLLRDDRGELLGFHNSCRHRGSILCQQEAGRCEAS